MADVSAAAGPRDLDDLVEDDPRLASLPETDASGLTEAEATRRRSLGMGNDSVIRTGRTYLEIIRENALNPVNVLLIAIAGVLAVLGLYGDAAVTLVLVVVNVVVGVYQPRRCSLPSGHGRRVRASIRCVGSSA